MKKPLVVGILMVLLISFSSIAFAGEQDFTLVNKTGVAIVSVFLCPNTSKTWGDDILGQNVLANGDSVDIVFHPGDKVAYWDIRVEDKSGDFLEWNKFNLKKIHTITLMKNGDAVFE
jgi:hypothetical protein